MSGYIAAESGRDVARWGTRAEALLERALGEHRNGRDALASTTEALACLYRAMGEAPDLVRIQAGDLVLDEPESVCPCPSDLVARGGFRGGCPVHATLSEGATT